MISNYDRSHRSESLHQNKDCASCKNQLLQDITQLCQTWVSTRKTKAASSVIWKVHNIHASPKTSSLKPIPSRDSEPYMDLTEALTPQHESDDCFFHIGARLTAHCSTYPVLDSKMIEKPVRHMIKDTRWTMLAFWKRKIGLSECT